MVISFNIYVTEMKFSTEVKNIHLGETVSQIFDIGLSSILFQKTFEHFLKLHFLDFIKQKLRPKSKI